MLIFSLILSGALLLLANYSVRRGEHPVSSIVTFATLFAILPNGLMLFLPALMLQSALLILITLAGGAWGRRPRTFLKLSCAASLASYLVVGWFIAQEITRLRDQFPYVSMEARLPARMGAAPVAPRPDAAAKTLDWFEAIVEVRKPQGWEEGRGEALRQLHEEAVETFINQQGFGYARMPRTVSEWTLKAGLRKEPPIPQPAPRSTDQWTDRALQAAPDKGESEHDHALLSMHLSGAADFVHPKGFGYFKDRRHVAGFQPHQFSEQPEALTGWTLKTLDLVGLVVHDEPVAYVSANLPRMDELRKAPTRPLDAFEAAGLAALRRGDDLFVRQTTDGRRRMLGAVRSVQQCLSCHGGERGELLGAFSYTLAPWSP
jgi:hypothetical protein